MKNTYIVQKKIKIHLLLSVFLFVYSVQSFAQKTKNYDDPINTYLNALSLFSKEKYPAAYTEFDKYLEESGNPHSENYEDAVYHKAVCALNLYQNDAVYLLENFIRNYPESPKVKLAYFQLGNYFFRKKKYKDVVKWYAKIDKYDLSTDELAEYYFKNGYAYFMLKDYAKAKVNFFEIKDTDTKYTAPARYYYAHIAYEEGNLETAYKTFKQLEGDPKFKVVVPFYLVQILYKQGKYDELLSYAPVVMDTTKKLKRSEEIARLVGESLYRTGRYEDAIPYLSQYVEKHTYDATPLDFYQLAYAYHNAKKCNKAEKYYQKAINGKVDSISQMAYYNLAKCYLKENNKKYAREAFYKAFEYDYDKEVKEDALFNFAKLSYELALYPYNDAINAFEEYINKYPDSPKLKNAYEYLLAIYYTTKNYEGALKSLDNIKVKDIKMLEAYQKIAHLRALELFNNHKYQEALKYFDLSDKYPYDKKIAAKNAYWRAETYYRLGDYKQAIEKYKQFISLPFASALPFYNKANYHIGYAYFKLKDYKNAEFWFRKFVNNESNQKSKVYADALNRIADCFFIQKDYRAAIEYYDKAIMANNWQVDYALYQSALANGVEKNYQDKADLLQTLIVTYPKSKYTDNAVFELGETYFLLNQPEKALQQYEKIITDYPNSVFYKKALLKKGLYYFNTKQDDEAIAVFKEVIDKYPQSEEAQQALEKIKLIYMDNGKLSEYEAYVSTLPFADAAATVQETDYYQVAENFFMESNCEKAIPAFTDYLNKYPNGIKAVEAHYYRGECLWKNKDFANALPDFETVIQSKDAHFITQALVYAARASKQLNDTAKTIYYYNELLTNSNDENILNEARKELLDIYIAQQNWERAAEIATQIINADTDNPLMLAKTHLTVAKNNLINLNDTAQALQSLQVAATFKNQYGAEAQYMIAEIYYHQHQYDLTETTVYNLVKNFPGYDYWIAKGFILLSDNFLAKEDIFQAKVTLENLLKNYHGDQALIAVAQQKLDYLKELENQDTNQKQEDIEIDLSEPQTKP